jgi:hypothetical protein
MHKQGRRPEALESSARSSHNTPLISHLPTAKEDGGKQTNKPNRERSARMTDKAKPPVSEVFDQAMKNYEQALRTGLKFQEDTGKCLVNLFNQGGSPQDAYKQFTSEVIPAAQKRFSECVELLEQNSRTGFDVLKKGVEATQTASIAETQTKWVDVCEQSLKSLRTNAQAVADINAKAIDSWIEFVKKASAEVTESKSAKA